MLKRMEMEPITPNIMLKKINASLSRDVLTHHIIRKALTYLEDHIPNLDSRFFTVVHGDVNHNNWLLSDRDELFLVDWEGAMIAIQPSILVCCYTTTFQNNNGLTGLILMVLKKVWT